MSRKASVNRRAIKRARKQERKDQRLALFVAIRMKYGKVPEFLSGQPIVKLRHFLETGKTYDFWGATTGRWVDETGPLPSSIRKEAE